MTVETHLRIAINGYICLNHSKRKKKLESIHEYYIRNDVLYRNQSLVGEKSINVHYVQSENKLIKVDAKTAVYFYFFFICEKSNNLSFTYIFAYQYLKLIYINFIFK